MTAECTHQWQTCPVHGRPDGELPSFRTVLTCLYGGLPTKGGGTWDERTSDEAAEAIADRVAEYLPRMGGEAV